MKASGAWQFGIPVLGTWLCVACGGEPPARPGATATVRDSAGVAIVESSVPAWSGAEAWRLGDQPLVDIGGSETDTAAQFGSIRSLHRLPNGEIAVLDKRSFSLRFFDARGAAVRRAGRRGLGPGEFPEGQLATSISCGTDSVYVRLIGRVLVFAASGRYVRQFSMTPAVSRYATVMACSGERWLGLSETTTWVDTTAGWRRDSVALAWYDNLGKPVAVIDTFPSEDRVYRWERGQLGYSVPSYSRRLAIAVGSRWMATGIGDSFEIAFHDSTGTLRRVARIAGGVRPMAAERDRYLDFMEAILANHPDPAGKILFNRGEIAATLPATIPAFADLRFDSEGNLWVRAYDFADATRQHVGAFERWMVSRGSAREQAEDRRWRVLGPSGVLLGDVQTPARFEVHEIGSDWMLGVSRDEHDVEHVRVYRIIKPGS